MDYEAYLQTKEWKQKKLNRLAFDNWQCGFCHSDLTGWYDTHHLNYLRLGHEDIEHDIISVCKKCHDDFHNVWKKSEYWKDTPLAHWRDYSLPNTALFCREYLGEDFMFGGESNMCNDECISNFIDKFYEEHEVDGGLFICETDIKLYFRNKRYDLLLEADKNGEPLEDMLDRMFGAKGIKGGNPKRAEARRFFTKHKLSAMKRIYKENDNILILMDEVNKI